MRSPLGSSSSSAAAANARITALAGDRAVHRAFRWLHLHEPQILAWQTAATAIPAPPFGETARARWVCDRFAELGLASPHIDAEGNALAEFPGSAHAPEASSTKPEPTDPHRTPVVLLSAHLDTVFPAGTDCTPRPDSPRWLAPGITDNGAGLAGLLALAAALSGAAPTGTSREGAAEPPLQPACTILFAANVGEEGEGDLRGMRHLFTAPPYAGRIAAALALEGAGTATVVHRALGSRRLRVTIDGPGGHSWADAGRPNPLVALSAAILAASRLPLPANPRSTLNCGAVRGGTSVNSIPARAEADIDLRSTSAHQLDLTELAVLRAFETAVAEGNDAATDLAGGLLRLHAERIGNRAPGELPESSPLFGSLRAVDRHLGLGTESRIGSTDANLPLSLGVPALALGAGGSGGGMHTLGEWFDPNGRSLALRRILLLLLDTCTLAANQHLNLPQPQTQTP